VNLAYLLNLALLGPCLYSILYALHEVVCVKCEPHLDLDLAFYLDLRIHLDLASTSTLYALTPSHLRKV
jgi:hypothetical protein